MARNKMAYLFKEGVKFLCIEKWDEKIITENSMPGQYDYVKTRKPVAMTQEFLANFFGII
jgi:hypothetical protein